MIFIVDINNRCHELSTPQDELYSIEYKLILLNKIRLIQLMTLIVNINI